MRIVIFLICLFWDFHLLAYNATIEDSIQVYYAKAVSFKERSNFNRDSLRFYAHKLIKAKKGSVDSMSLEAKTLLMIANFHYEYDDYKPLAHELIEESQRLGQYDRAATEMFYLANKAHTAGLDEAEKEYLNGIGFLETYEESIGDPFCYLRSRFRSGLASYYEYNARYQKALETIFVAIDEAENCSDKKALMSCYKTASATIGSMSEKLDYEIPGWTDAQGKLQYYLEQTYLLAKELESHVVEALAAYNLAFYHYEQDSLVKSREYLELSNKVLGSEKMFRQQYYNNMLLSDISQKEDNKEESFRYLQLALSSAEKLNEPRTDMLSKLDHLNWHLAYNNLDQAAELFNVLKESIENHPELKIELYESAHTLFERKGDMQNALSYYKSYVALNDSIKTESKQTEVAALMNEFDKLESEKRIALLMTENLKSKLHFQYILFSALSLVLLLALLFWWQYHKQKMTRISLENEKLDLEQRLLRVSMNPHFIFNTLGSIQSYLLNKGKAEQGAYYLTKFAKLMRQILEQSQASIIPLSEEISTLKNYLNLQKMRFQDKFKYEISVDDGIDVDQFNIPPMLIQPVVENAIEHGKVYLKEDGLIKIEFISEGNFLKIRILDNGVGLKLKPKDNITIDKTSMALTLIMKRLSDIKKSFGNEVGFGLSNNHDCGACAELILPRF